jgi:ubiquinone/menaquinone biosynthesis C-methylase UbiE
MSAVPAYETMLAAYHRAFAAELQAMIATLPIEAGSRILDMACGDGAYTPWLAQRAGAGGYVAAVDKMPAYARLAQPRMAGIAVAAIEALPFADDSFDLCWCAQSFYSLPDPQAALRQMLRVIRPGGVVAVLEADTLHNILLPWPVEVELAMRIAEFTALSGETRPRKFYVARQLRHVFHQAGLESVKAHTFIADRAAPLGEDERIYLGEYVEKLANSVMPHLEGAMRGRVQTLTDPASAGFILNDPELTVACIDYLVWGRKPAP